jgi:hypothetical protein
MIRGVKSKLKAIQLLLAISLALPISLAMSTSPALASGSCYWSRSLNSQVWAYPGGGGGVVWTGDVIFQLGYDCSGNPNNFFVQSDTETATFQDTTGHAWTQFFLCQFWNTSYCNTWTASYFNQTCHNNGNGTCTVSRTQNVYAIMPFNPSAAVVGHWYNCYSPGNDLAKCDIVHQFWQGTAYVF